MKMKKIYIFTGLVILLYIGFMEAYPYYYVYNEKIPPKVEFFQYEDGIEYNSLEEKIIFDKINKKFSKDWFRVLYLVSLRQSDDEMLEKTMLLGMKNLSTNDAIHYLLYYGIYGEFKNEMINYLNNLQSTEMNRDIILKHYCEWAFQLDDTLKDKEVRFKSNSLEIQKLKEKFNINKENCESPIPFLLKLP